MRGLKRTCPWLSQTDVLCAVDRHLADKVLGLTGAPVVADIAATKPAEEPLQRRSPQDAAVSVLVLNVPAPSAEGSDLPLVVRGDVVTDALLATSGDGNYGTGIEFSHC